LQRLITNFCNKIELNASSAEDTENARKENIQLKMCGNVCFVLD